MVGALLCSLLIWIARAILGRYIPWFATDRGGAILALSIGILSALIATFATGRPTWNTITDGIKLGAVAIGAFVGGKKILTPSDKQPDPVK